MQEIVQVQEIVQNFKFHLKFTCLAQNPNTTKHDYMIDMSVIFRPIATRNEIKEI